jgi:hypothetical protein
MSDDDLLTKARAWLAEERRRTDEQRQRRIAEFPTFRPTPNVDECDRAALGEIVMIKEWDLSPIDPASFDPFEPPGRPGIPPANTVPPLLSVISDLTVGSMLAVSAGTWTNATTYARQWLRAGAAIAGATATSYTLAAADIGAMISARVTATGVGGGGSAESNAVGPIEAAR